jgi:hypothetical protein
MKVLEPKWKQEQRRSLQNTANKYAKLTLFSDDFVQQDFVSADLPWI